ncbi:MAG: LEPR-XLL domain-containing protein [Planctomycetota bacterium]|nr:MAG: LEPR-XLL domain-containing protein [Planctomycetota bacterium]
MPLKSRSRPGRAASRRHAPRRLAVEQLEDRMLLSASIRIGAMGDSLTAPYAGEPYVAPGERNWVEQLQLLRSNHVTIYDEAVPGATSSSLLAQGQATAVADLVAHGAIDYAVLIVGGNDIPPYLPSIFAGNTAPFVTTVVANIETALNTVAAADDVRLVVGNIPDVGRTPAFQTFVTNNPFLLQGSNQRRHARQPANRSLCGLAGHPGDRPVRPRAPGGQSSYPRRCADQQLLWPGWFPSRNRPAGDPGQYGSGGPGRRLRCQHSPAKKS